MSGYPEPLYGAAPPSRPSGFTYQPTASTSGSALQSSSIRAEHLAALRRRIPECRPKNTTETVWEMPVTTHDQVPVHIRISVPTSYPQDPPSVSVVEFQNLNHFWVDHQTGKMSDHLIKEWAATKSSLITVVESAFEALSGRSYSPPAPEYSAAYLPPSSAGPSGLPWGTSSPVRRNGRAGGGSTSPVRLRQDANVLAALERKSAEELEALVVDPAAFAAFMQPFLLQTELGQRVAAVKKEVSVMAKQNMGLLDEYENTRQQIQVTNAAELSPAKHHYNELMARQTAVISTLDLSGILDKMKAECEARNDSSMLLERQFVSGPGPVTDAATVAFVSSFVEDRRRFHTTKIKLDASKHVLHASGN